MKGGLNAFGMAGLQKELSWVGAKIGSKPTKAKSSSVVSHNNRWIIIIPTYYSKYLYIHQFHKSYMIQSQSQQQNHETFNFVRLEI